MTDLIVELEDQLAQTPSPIAQIQVLSQLAEELHYSELERAYALAQQAYTLATQLDDEEGALELAGAATILGYLNLLKGETETAVTQLFQALTIYNQQQNSRGQARASGKIGLTFSRIGNYPEALKYHLQQLHISQEYNISSEEAAAYNGIGIVHSYTNQHQEALDTFQKSLQLSRQNNNLHQQAMILANCAYSSNRLAQFEEALQYGQQSLEIAQQNNNLLSASHAHMELATTYCLRQDYSQALEQLQANLNLLSSTSLTYPHAETLLAIGRLYNNWQKPESALTYLEQALTLSQQAQSTYTIYRCHQEMSISYQQLRDFESAFEHFQKFHHLKEQVFNEKTVANLRALEINYQMEASRKEKEMLRKQNVQLEEHIQERMKAEEELKEYQNHLEELVRQRTIKLERKNEELERFAYTVSHDLKSPLITIRGFLGLLERDMQRNDKTKIERNMQRIDLAAERMLKLLEDLLELSRIGHTPSTLAHLPLQAIILEARELVTGRIKENNVKLIIEDNLPEIYGDYPRLVEVFQNLIDNSCKFMGDQPQPQIIIGAKHEGDAILCYVKDNGIGIAPQYQEKIFKLFERLDQSISGTGIGLALVKRIVEYHNGRIWVESEGENTGSTFYFTLKEPVAIMQ